MLRTSVNVVVVVVVVVVAVVVVGGVTVVVVAVVLEVFAKLNSMCGLSPTTVFFQINFD